MLSEAHDDGSLVASDDDFMGLLAGLSMAALDGTHVDFDAFWTALKPLMEVDSHLMLQEHGLHAPSASGDFGVTSNMNMGSLADMAGGVTDSMRNLEIVLDDRELGVYGPVFEHLAPGGGLDKVDLQCALHGMFDRDMVDAEKMFLFNLTGSIEMDSPDMLDFMAFVHVIKEAEDALADMGMGLEAELAAASVIGMLNQ